MGCWISLFAIVNVEPNDGYSALALICTVSATGDKTKRLFCLCTYLPSGFCNARSPLEIWIDHIRQAILWDSKTSRKRCGSRRSPLYAAMSAVNPSNVIQVVLALPTYRDLASAERFFIRKLQPVFNLRELDDSVLHLAQSLSTVVADDVVTMETRVFRQTRPRISPLQWASLIANMALAGEIGPACPDNMPKSVGFENSSTNNYTMRSSSEGCFTHSKLISYQDCLLYVRL